MSIGVLILIMAVAIVVGLAVAFGVTEAIRAIRNRHKK